MPFSKLYLDIAEFDIRILYRIDYWDLGVFGQQKRLKPLRDKGLTSIYDFP